MHSRTRLRTTHTLVALCSLVVVSFILVSSLGAPSVQAGVTPTITPVPPTETPVPPTETPEPTETQETPEPTKKKTPPPADTPTPYPTPPPPPTFTPAPAPEVTPVRIFAPKTGGGDGAALPFGVWQIGLGLVLIGIAIAWSRRRRPG